MERLHAHYNVERKTTRINRWVRYTSRVYLTDGSSKYTTGTIAQLDGQTNKDTADYLIRDFEDIIRTSDSISKLKLISIDGEKLNTVIE